MKNPLKKEKKQELIITDAQQLQNIVSGAFNSQNTSNLPDNSAKELEISKLILAMIANHDYDDSTTNLNEDEIEDLANAHYLNLIFDSDLIDEFCTRYKTLKRSQTKEPHNLLTILAEMAGKSFDVQSNGMFDKILGNRK